MRIICLASTKGGVGKSTYAAALSDAFLRTGKTVRTFDLDQQRSVSRWADEVAKVNPNLTSHFLSMPDGANIETCYNELDRLVEDEPDWVIIDTKGTNDPRNLAALAFADLVIVPSGPIDDEARGIEMTLQNYKQALIAMDDDANPNDHFRVAYRPPGQFPGPDMRALKELIFQHYGAFEGLTSSNTTASFLGWRTTTDDLISEMKAEKKSTQAVKNLQKRFDELAQKLEEQLNAA